MVVRHHEELRQKEEKAKRDEHAKIRKIASNIAKEIRSFWTNVEKVQKSLCNLYFGRLVFFCN